MINFNYSKIFSGILAPAVLAAIFLLRAGAVEIPPKIFNVKILEITSDSATIYWETDKPADALINYGLNKHYGVSREPGFTKKEHTLVLEDLIPGTEYFFQVVSADQAGNQTIVGGYSLTTKGQKPRPGIGEEQTAFEQTMALLEGMTTPDLLARIAERAEERLGEIIEPPKILGPPRLEIGSDYVIINWSTDKEANSMVALASERDYDPGRPDPYTRHEGRSDEMNLEHSVRIDGLTPNTLYHYKISSKGRLGLATESPDYTFKTKAILPQVLDIRLEKVEEYSATIAVSANLPVSAVIEYKNLRTGESGSKGSPALSVSHLIKLTELEFGTAYSAIARVENEIGDKAESQPLNFTTQKDEYPPIISRITTESTLYPGAETKIQTIVSWETDEPAWCQFFFQQGLTSGGKYNSFPEEANPVVKHVQVITVFEPSTVYKFWLVCRDQAENEVRSEDFVLFTPEKEKSIIDIIIENFEGAFGWVKKIQIGR